MSNTALIVGASGIVGSATAALLLREGWTVRRSRAPSGRRPGRRRAGGRATCRIRLADARRWPTSRPPTSFIATWLRQPTEAENIRVNRRHGAEPARRASPGGSVRHVALVTGLKHYLGPFEAYGKGALPQTPFREDQGRARHRELLLRPGGRGVRGRRARRLHLERAPPAHDHRLGGGQRHEHGHDARRLRHPVPGDGAAVRVPGLGRAVERADRHDRRPPARPPPALGRHRAEAAANEAFNVVNGDVFRWSWMWAAHRRLVRPRGGAVRRHAPAAGAADGAATGRPGRRSPRATASPSRTSTGSPPPGTRMPISAARSRSSPT